MTITRAPKEDQGCWVDGHWGQYGIARVIEFAIDAGWEDEQAKFVAAKHLASMGPSTSEPLTDDEYEAMMGAGDEAEQWLNDNVAAEDMCFGWNDGEFFYMATTWWSDEGDEF